MVEGAPAEVPAGLCDALGTLALLGGELRELARRLKQQQEQIDTLSISYGYIVRAHLLFREQHTALDTQHRALCDSLHRCGLLHRADVLRQLHSRWCRATREGTRALLGDVLDEADAARNVVHCVDAHSAIRFCLTSRSCLESVWCSLSEIALESPGQTGLAAGSCWLSRISLQRQAATLNAALRQRPGPLLGAGGLSRAARQVASAGPAALGSLLCGPRPAEALARALQPATARRLRAVSRASRDCVDHSSLLIESPAPGRQPELVIGSGRECSLPAAEPSLAALPRCGALEQARAPVAQGMACMAFLQDVWQYSILMDALTCLMSRTSVRQFRTVSRSCCECMRGTSAGPGTAAAVQLQHGAAAARSLGEDVLPLRAATVLFGSVGIDCLALLQDAWQYTILADALTCAMGAATVRQFCAVSRAGCECMRSFWTRRFFARPRRSPAAAVKLLGAVAQAKQQPEPEPPLQVVLRGGAPRALARTVHKRQLEQARRRCGQSQAAGGPRRLAPTEPFRTGPWHGELVRLRGLRSAMRLNGTNGMVMSYDAESGRFHVLLTTGEAVRVQMSNLDFADEAVGRRFTQLVSRPAGGPPGGIKGRRGLPQTGRALGDTDTFLRAAAFLPPAARGALAQASPALADRVLSRRIFLCGGLKNSSGGQDCECFDTATGAWRPVPPLSRERMAASLAVVGGQLYIIGGADVTSMLKSVECFDPAVGAWQPMPPMLRQRSFPLTAVIGKCIYVCGGCLRVEAIGVGACRTPVALRSLERFDPGCRVWQMLAPMQQPRYHAVAAVLGGRLHVSGGMDAAELSSAERYDPAAGTWEPLLPMDQMRVYACHASFSGRLYVCGGSQGAVSLRSAELFSTLSNSWEALPPMLRPRSGAVAAASRAGRLFVSGGCQPEAASRTESLSPGANAWEMLAWGPVRGQCFPSAVVAGEHLYIFGGGDGPSVLLSTADRLHLPSGTWEVLASMPEARSLAA